MTARSPQRHQLESLLQPVVAAEGYDLEEVSVTAAGRRSLIRVTVDGDDGIDLDGIATVSHAVSEALDAAEQEAPAFAGPYVLEVSSPGVDRPLTEPRHWRRSLGRLATVPVGPAGQQVSRLGRILAADSDGLELAVDDRPERYHWAEVGTGRIQVEFSRPGEHLPTEATDEEA
jgi:ribosome maturation factor RimP